MEMSLRMMSKRCLQLEEIISIDFSQWFVVLDRVQMQLLNLTIHLSLLLLLEPVEQSFPDRMKGNAVHEDGDVEIYVNHLNRERSTK